MEKRKLEISSLTLHIIAMAAMLLDHMWATVMSGNLWMNCVGRIAFPIFAFMTVEGYFHTHNMKKYLQRLLIFALLSEIPFNLMNEGTIVSPFHQNVIWTFLIALLMICGIEKAKQKGKTSVTVLAAVGYTLLGFLLGTVLMVDYSGTGVLMVLLFYFLHGRKWYHFAGQLIGMYWINGILIKGMDIPLTLMGHEFFLSVQSIAVLALIPIWLYRGKQGPHNKAIQYSFYAFYPVHMLVLYLILMLF